MEEPFIGEIAMIPFNWAPYGWALCDGQLLPIGQYAALYSLIGTTYGGDGKTTFALPDLRGRVAINQGYLNVRPSPSLYRLGQSGGAEQVTLGVNQMPSHNHNIQASNDAASTGSPEGKVLANTGRTSIYGDQPAATMATGTISPAGGSQPVSIVQPYLTINFIIALEGIYPQRP